MAGYKQIANEIGRQFSIQFLGNFGAQLLEGKDFNPGKAVHDALINIDIGDAIISSMDFDAFTTLIGTSMIDITAIEAEALGLGKEAKKVNIDMLFNAIASSTDKLPKGKYADLTKRIENVIEDKAKKFVKDALEPSTNKDVQNFLDENSNPNEIIHEPDALRVNTSTPINQNIPESISEDSNSGG